MSKIKLVVFDWNGTLFADTQVIVDIVNEIWLSLGKKPMTLRRYQETLEVPFYKFWMANGFNRTEVDRYAKRVGEHFHRSYEDQVKDLRTRRGARNVLEHLSSSNIRAIILSNHTQTGVDFQMKRLKLGGYFESVIGNHRGIETTKGRSKSGKVFDYIKRHSISAQSAMIVGDNVEEIEIGKEHGMITVAIIGGANSERRLRNASPDHLISSLTELRGIIESYK